MAWPGMWPRIQTQMRWGIKIRTTNPGLAHDLESRNAMARLGHASQASDKPENVARHDLKPRAGMVSPETRPRTHKWHRDQDLKPIWCDLDLQTQNRLVTSDPVTPETDQKTQLWTQDWQTQVRSGTSPQTQEHPLRDREWPLKRHSRSRIVTANLETQHRISTANPKMWPRNQYLDSKQKCICILT